MFAGKPIIGIVGGIGSGKSFIADLFAPLGCLVVHSDNLVDEAYNDPEVKRKLAEWWGARAVATNGRVSRQGLAQIVFADPDARRRLEELLHPIVFRRRQELMAQAAGDANIRAFVWDSPLLMETGLHRQCDAVVFIQTPLEMRLDRLARMRNWEPAELTRRENLQYPLDKKREISEYVIDNTADADYARGQVEDVLSRIRG